MTERYDLVVVGAGPGGSATAHYASKRSEEHTSELQSRQYLVCRLLLEKKNIKIRHCALRFPVQRKTSELLQQNLLFDCTLSSYIEFNLPNSQTNSYPLHNCKLLPLYLKVKFYEFFLSTIRKERHSPP